MDSNTTISHLYYTSIQPLVFTHLGVTCNLSAKEHESVIITVSRRKVA